MNTIPLSLHPLIRLIEDQTGLKIREQEHEMLQKFVAKRLQALGLDQIQHYCDFLNSANHLHLKNDFHKKSTVATSDESEWQILIDQITTGESYFWRDSGQLKVISEHLLPELIQAKRAAAQQGQTRQLSLRLWSAGCSTGEEAYTLAILLRELLSDFSQWQILILGIDLNPKAIAKAKQGIYTAWSFRQTPSDIKCRYFQKVADDWQVNNAIHSIPRFQSGNLLQHSCPDFAANLYDMDLILCRNVFIYFPAQVIANVLQEFYKSLNPGGYLICGHTELQAQDLSAFQTISFPASTVYKRPSISRQAPMLVAMPHRNV